MESAGTPSKIFSLESLSLFTEEKVLFQDLSLDVFAGDRVGILGENGSGKTTLLKTILGQVKPKAGRVLLQGTPVREISALERAKFIGYLPQRLDQLPSLTVQEFLSACAEQKKLKESLLTWINTEKMTKKFGLEGKENQLLSTLSGGELRRVLFGVALLGNPTLLLLDEPLVSLDTTARGKMIELVNERLKGNDDLTAVIVSHDEEFLFHQCNRIFKVAHCGLIDLLKPEEERDVEEETPPKEWIQ